MAHHAVLNRVATKDEDPLRKIEDSLSTLDKLAIWKLLRWWRTGGKVAVHTLLLDLWNDPAKFRAALRATIVALATAVNTGVIPVPLNTWGWYLTQFAMAVAVGIPAGQTNPKPVEEGQ